MKVSKISNLKSGSLDVCQYNKEGFNKIKGRLTKAIIYDIYNKTDFSKDICFIATVSPKDEYTISDVIKEYIDKSWGKNTLILTQAGTLSNIPRTGKLNDGIDAINKEKDELYKANFVNIIFNQVANLSYGNTDIFIYIDELSNKEFITNNIGLNEDNKLINRTK